MRLPIHTCTVAGIALVLSACASVPPPTEQLAVSRTAIEEAQTAGAGKHAPVELASAREKLEQARRAVQDEQNERARMLAEQAEADAKLAAMRARSAQSQETIAALQESIRTLRNELDRAAPGKPQ